MVTAQAAVVFDTQPPLSTAAFVNTIDTGAGMTSRVNALPAYETTTRINVSWGGTDAATSSGIQSYTIYVSDNGGPYTAWLTSSLQTWPPFFGQMGHTYAFYSQAMDNVFNVEPTHATADTQTLLTTNPQPVFIVSAPTSATAGTAFTITVTAEDAGGHLLTSYRGTVHFTSSDLKAVLPINYTFTATDNGKHVFKILFKTAGTQTVTITDTVDSNQTVTTPAITVHPGVAKKYVLSIFPTTPVAGTAYTMTVTAEDAYNNIATAYRGTVHFSTTDPSPLVVLPADYAFTAIDSGVHTFTSGITLITAGAQTITVGDTVTTTLKLVKKVTVKPAALYVLLVFGFPSPATAGTAHSFMVEAVDKYNNKVTTYRDKIHFTSSDPAWAPPLDYTFTATDAGLHTFSATLNTVSNNQSITATDTKTHLAGSQTGVQVVACRPRWLRWTPPARRCPLPVATLVRQGTRRWNRRCFSAGQRPQGVARTLPWTRRWRMSSLPRRWATMRRCGNGASGHRSWISPRMPLRGGRHAHRLASWIQEPDGERAQFLVGTFCSLSQRSISGPSWLKPWHHSESSGTPSGIAWVLQAVDAFDFPRDVPVKDFADSAPYTHECTAVVVVPCGPLNRMRGSVGLLQAYRRGHDRIFVVYMLSVRGDASFVLQFLAASESEEHATQRSTTCRPNRPCPQSNCSAWMRTGGPPIICRSAKSTSWTTRF